MTYVGKVGELVLPRTSRFVVYFTRTMFEVHWGAQSKEEVKKYRHCYKRNVRCKLLNNIVHQAKWLKTGHKCPLNAYCGRQTFECQHEDVTSATKEKMEGRISLASERDFLFKTSMQIRLLYLYSGLFSKIFFVWQIFNVKLPSFLTTMCTKRPFKSL
jgi:hypothetical protein